MKTKSIKAVYRSKRVNMGGIILDQPLPTDGIDQLDPFLLIHHWKHKYNGGNKQSDIGVGPHPHRGFSPVTFIFKGGVHHRDSLGNDSIVMAGGTQWMHSGSGIVHSERPVREIAENGGEFEIVQFWVNTPAANKLEEPEYFPVQKSDTPIIADDNYEIDVITGELNNTKGAIKTFSPMLICNMRFKKGAKLEINIPTSYNALIYILDGKLEINGSNAITDKTMVVFDNNHELVSISAHDETRAILLSGYPLNEPVASYGPMVMNTNDEIIQALNDYQNGSMGNLNENFN